jgi:uncharacterized protein YjbI with pentapeptide repeats
MGLKKVDLSNQHLPVTMLTGADLSGANLSGAILFGANLSGANLSGANLSGTILFGANLSGADISRADLSRADLSGANLSNVKINMTNFEMSKLTSTYPISIVTDIKTKYPSTGYTLDLMQEELLAKLGELKQKGHLTEEEFQKMKASLIAKM